MINWILTKIKNTLLKSSRFNYLVSELAKDEASKHVSDLIQQTFNEAGDALTDSTHFHTYYNSWPISRMRNSFKKSIEESVQRETLKLIKHNLEQFEEYIKSEKFIDSIISRINSKQLGGS